MFIVFCRNCGHQIDEQSDFCSQCGARVTMEPVTNQEKVREVFEPSESAISVFQVQRKYSMFNIVSCNVVFFKDKVALAHLSSALRKAETQKATDAVKEKGLGFLKGSAEMMRYWSKFNQRYYHMGLDEILAEDPSNMVISYRDITKVLFKASRESFISGDDSSSSTVSGKMEITLNQGEEIKFTHGMSSSREIKELLTNFFGDKLKYKK